VWDGDLLKAFGRMLIAFTVLSPPCGMETLAPPPASRPTEILSPCPLSEPTARDGDLPEPTGPLFMAAGFPPQDSEPTVWDGDTYSSGEYAGSGRSSEPTKPTAWDGDYNAVGISFVLPSRSKPTEWDGDIGKLRKRLTKVYSFFCSEPTAWDGDHSRRTRASPPSSKTCSEPTAWGGDVR